MSEQVTYDEARQLLDGMNRAYLRYERVFARSFGKNYPINCVCDARHGCFAFETIEQRAITGVCFRTYMEGRGGSLSVVLPRCIPMPVVKITEENSTIILQLGDSRDTN